MDGITLYEWLILTLKIAAVLGGSLLIGMLWGAFIRKGGRDED
jgi:hypothetical protein